MLSIDSDAFGVDWNQKLSNVYSHPKFGKRAIQGNLDPICFYQDWPDLKKDIDTVLEESAGSPGGYVFNVGHGLTPETPLDSIAKTVEYVKSK